METLERSVRGEEAGVVGLEMGGGGPGRTGQRKAGGPGVSGRVTLTHELHKGGPERTSILDVREASVWSHVFKGELLFAGN